MHVYNKEKLLKYRKNGEKMKKKKIVSVDLLLDGFTRVQFEMNRKILALKVASEISAQVFGETMEQRNPQGIKSRYASYGK